MHVHPSQRRVACELCKKHKTKCQRLQQTDLKCSRCTMLGADCDPGHQKKVGRPRQSVPISARKVLKIKANTADAKLTSGSVDRRRVSKEHDRLQSESEITSSYGQNAKNSTFVPTPLPSPATTPPSTVHESIYNQMSKWPSMTKKPSNHNPQSWTQSTGLLAIPDDEATMTDPYSTTFIPSPEPSTEEDCSDHESSWPILATIPLQQATISRLLDATGTKNNAYSKASDALYFDTENRTITVRAASATISYSSQPDISHTLSKISLELEFRRVVIEYNRSNLDLDALIYQHGPLFINNYTLGEYLISATQEFLQVSIRLRESMESQTNRSFVPSDAPEHLTHAQARDVTSIFMMLLSFYELFLEHLTSRIERISTRPVAPIPGLTFNGRLLARPCDQGVLFCQVALSLLERLENVLGIVAKSDEAGLLSSEQIEDLWSQLDGGDGVASGRGIMRPADVKSLFRKVAAVFERLSLTMDA
jgi:hypothetical protein